jgi:hypothetical protein
MYKVGVVAAVAVVFCGVAARLTSPGSALAQNKKADKKDIPKIANCSPIAVKAGATAKVNIRGFKLDAATEIKFADAKITGKLVKKEKATVPQNQPPEKWGDTQASIEIVVPADAAPGMLNFTVVTPAGEAPAFLLLGSVHPLIKEQEPNPGFRKAQPIAIPQAVDAAIGEALDVDVYRFAAESGRTIVFEVWAARAGSLLDARIAVYDESGRELAVADDLPDGVDCRLEFAPPRDGTYFVAVSDAHEAGGNLYAYRLVAAQK